MDRVRLALRGSAPALTNRAACRLGLTPVLVGIHNRRQARRFVARALCKPVYLAPPVIRKAFVRLAVSAAVSISLMVCGPTVDLVNQGLSARVANVSRGVAHKIAARRIAGLTRTADNHAVLVQGRRPFA